MGPIRNRAKLWPANVSAQVSAEIKEALRAEAARQGVKEADVIREWLDAGHRSARRRNATQSG